MRHCLKNSIGIWVVVFHEHSSFPFKRKGFCRVYWSVCVGGGGWSCWAQTWGLGSRCFPDVTAGWEDNCFGSLSWITAKVPVPYCATCFAHGTLATVARAVWALVCILGLVLGTVPFRLWGTTGGLRKTMRNPGDRPSESSDTWPQANWHWYPPCFALLKLQTYRIKQLM